MKAHLLVAAALCTAAAVRAAPADDKPPETTKTPEPAVQRQVSEDDNVRIEELRVRGQTQSIVVKSKIPGVAPYQIVPSSGARDPSQIGDTSGQSVWHFLSF